MKVAVLVGVGDYYKSNKTGYAGLHFVYRNLDDLQVQLQNNGWHVRIPMVDPAADRASIINSLEETLESLNEETDEMLFYFTGHGNRKLVPTENGIRNDMYCVTADPRLKYDTVLPITSFFSEFDYAAFARKFQEKIKRGHLITIMDCCFAGGIVENMTSQNTFHTVIAASSENRKSFYKDNSFFFEALKKSWNEGTAGLVAAKIKSEMKNIPGAQDCQISLAQDFRDKPLL